MAKLNLQVESIPSPAPPGFVRLFVDSADGVTKQEDEHGVVKAFAIVQTRTVSIPSAEVLALNTTTIELAPAPPSGSMILVTSVFASLSGVGTPYATHTNLGGYFGSTLTLAFRLTDFLSHTVDSVATTDFNSLYDGFALVASDANGAALNLAVGEGNPTDGDGNLSVTVTYQVIALA